MKITSYSTISDIKNPILTRDFMKVVLWVKKTKNPLIEAYKIIDYNPKKELTKNIITDNQVYCKKCEVFIDYEDLLANWCSYGNHSLLNEVDDNWAENNERCLIW